MPKSGGEDVDETLYREILTEAGVDVRTINSGISDFKELSRNPREYHDNLLADVLYILNSCTPSVEKLRFETVSGKIFVNNPETDFSAEYRPGVIKNALEDSYGKSD